MCCFFSIYAKDKDSCVAANAFLKAAAHKVYTLPMHIKWEMEKSCDLNSNQIQIPVHPALFHFWLWRQMLLHFFINVQTPHISSTILIQNPLFPDHFTSWYWPKSAAVHLLFMVVVFFFGILLYSINSMHELNHSNYSTSLRCEQIQLLLASIYFSGLSESFSQMETVVKRAARAQAISI